MGEGAEVGRSRNCSVSREQSSQAGGPAACVKAAGDGSGTGGRGPPMQGVERPAEELGLRATSSRGHRLLCSRKIMKNRATDVCFFSAVGTPVFQILEAAQLSPQHLSQELGKTLYVFIGIGQ